VQVIIGTKSELWHPQVVFYCLRNQKGIFLMNKNIPYVPDVRQKYRYSAKMDSIAAAGIPSLRETKITALDAFI